MRHHSFMRWASATMAALMFFQCTAPVAFAADDAILAESSSIHTVVNGTAAYQVVAEPKFSWDAKPLKPAVPSLKPDPSLPQTGQLNWPIPILIAMGLSLILLGGWLQRKSDHEK